MSFVTKTNILNDVRHGFREGKSTVTATHAFLKNIQKAIGIFLIYQKRMMY